VDTVEAIAEKDKKTGHVESHSAEDWGKVFI
jgi:hypothetical protein